MGKYCSFLRLLLAVLLMLTTTACSIIRDFQPSVAVSNIHPKQYIAQQRDDVLTTGSLSQQTLQAIRVSGLDESSCKSVYAIACIESLSAISGLSDEKRLSAVAELWLQYAIKNPTDNFSAWMNTAKYAYAYLFFSERQASERAFEDRQTLVRDWYNYAVQQATISLFKAQSRNTKTLVNPKRYSLSFDGWIMHIDIHVRLPQNANLIQELLPANSLGFEGLRSVYKRDGFGAEFVAVTAPNLNIDNGLIDACRSDLGSLDCQRLDWSEMPYPDITVVFRFGGNNLAQVLAQDNVDIDVYDPFTQDSLDIYGQKIPLSANFTAGYGLWLAESNFSGQSIRSLFGYDKGLQQPHLYMMQPYDPDKRIILMLHGLASSPEAWVNVANEILGDETLRDNFQIWQIYYPTNMPVAINHTFIRQIFENTLQNFDPDSSQKASSDTILIGHSMGGMISRLMVSNTDDRLWDWMLSEHEVKPENLARIETHLRPILVFEPIENINRVIFIASPHRGTAVASNRFVRWLGGFIRLPLEVLKGIDQALVPSAFANDTAVSARKLAIPNSLDNLDAQDSFVMAAADLPISESVKIHSIIARQNEDGLLEDSDDGLVPYTSAHLDQAISEKIIVSGHSVQETPAAINEIKRILHEDIGVGDLKL